MDQKVRLYSELLGKTFVKVVKTTNRYNQDELIFYLSDSSGYRFTHDQECCESVYIEDVCGELNDLVGSPILQAEEVSQKGDSVNSEDSETWTFYKFQTAKGSVTVRWIGSSNGYYSERVDFEAF